MSCWGVPGDGAAASKTNLSKWEMILLQFKKNEWVLNDGQACLIWLIDDGQVFTQAYLYHVLGVVQVWDVACSAIFLFFCMVSRVYYGKGKKPLMYKKRKKKKRSNPISKWRQELKK